MHMMESSMLDDDLDRCLLSRFAVLYDRGDQKWVHEECLKRWQRSVLVTQPTHPAFYEKDDRQFVCSVCRAPFSLAPPDRHSMMLGFTGAELAAYIDVGCMIVSERSKCAQIAHLLRTDGHLPQIRRLTMR